MIAVVIPTLNADRTLGDVLAALVPAASDGWVREVIIVDAGSSDLTAEIAEDCGAIFLSGPAGRAARIAQGVAAVSRAGWVLVLDQHTAPKEAWRRAAEAALKQGRAVHVPVFGLGLAGRLARPRAGALFPRR